jgi:hypothetical protein
MIELLLPFGFDTLKYSWVNATIGICALADFSVAKKHQHLPLPHFRAFLGLAGYYRHFTKNYGAIAAPLTTLLKKDVFKWSAEAEEAFWALQCTLTTAPILQLPNFYRDFVVECDASGMGLAPCSIKVVARWPSSVVNWLRGIPSFPFTSGNSSGWSKQCDTGGRPYGGAHSSSRPNTSA